MNIDPAGLPPAIQRRMHADKRKEIAPSQERRLRGKQAQADGQSFEQRVEATFAWYREQDIAWLFRLPVPTAPAPKHDQRARGLRVLSGQAMFDVFGWLIRGAGFIGAELKSTAKKERRLPIVAEGKKGSGLQQHQLNALASLARCGGIARVVWRNGDEIGVLAEDDILQAQAIYAEGGRGTRSIPWGWFRLAPYMPDVGFLRPDWLGLFGKGKGKP